MGSEDGDDDSSPDTLSETVVCIDDAVYFRTEVTPVSTMVLLQRLAEANENAIKKSHFPGDARVFLYIHSGGGDLFAGLSALDHLRNNRVKVITVADGFVASAATLMLLAGAERKALKNAKILIHQLSTFFAGKYGEMCDEMTNSNELMESLRSVYQQETNMTAKKVNSMLKKEIHINSDEAVKLGVVDEVW
tara:strand:- start:56 stop:631 length:576 start_codon:yes stop_codon:yes gene_type:complete